MRSFSISAAVVCLWVVLPCTALRAQQLGNIQSNVAIDSTVLLRDAAAAVTEQAAADLPDAPVPFAEAAAAQYSSGSGAAEAHPQDSTSGHEATWRSAIPDILHDEGHVVLSPLQLRHGYAWIPAVAVVGGTAGMIVADPHIMPYFRTHAKNLDDINDVFDQWITTGEIVAGPVSLLAAGTLRHDSYMTSTAYLAGEAYADSALIELAVKAVSRRERPVDVAPGQNFNHTFFNSNESVLKGSSFPSGHAAGAFSVATVVACRYKNHRWVPWAAYGMATAISLSRITTSAHFPSDVFLGAALGYTITRFETLRPR